MKQIQLNEPINSIMEHAVTGSAGFVEPVIYTFPYKTDIIKLEIASGESLYTTEVPIDDQFDVMVVKKDTDKNILVTLSTPVLPTEAGYENKVAAYADLNPSGYNFKEGNGITSLFFSLIGTSGDACNLYIMYYTSKSYVPAQPIEDLLIVTNDDKSIVTDDTDKEITT